MKGALMCIRWEYVIEGIVIGVSAGVAIQIINIVSKYINFHQEEKIIVNFLKEAIKEYHKGFRSTIIICNAVNLPEERVRYICNRSKKIRRNEKEKESWTLKGGR